MKTKDLVLKKLEENRDNFISGEKLAKELDLSRTAIWKAINSLKKEGFPIDSVTKRGYRLDKSSDLLSIPGIRNNLDKEIKDIDIYLYDEIDSTNTQAKRILNDENVKNFTLLISDYQSKGKGRTGKTFKSYKGTGIYFSIIIKPEMGAKFQDIDLVTLRAAASMTKAIESLKNEDVSIKWVNDIYLGKKKVCGILTEVDANFETMNVNSIIVGIGVNLKEPVGGFNEELKNIATVLDVNKTKNELASLFVNEFYKTYYKEEAIDVLNYYKAHSIVLNRDIVFEKNGKSFEAYVKDINDKGNLVVDIDGKEEIISSGEIKLKSW